MGYSEVRCWICGVSFNIGRIRRPDEPAEDAWVNYGFAQLEDDRAGCDPMTHGCRYRKIPDDERSMREGSEWLYTRKLPETQCEGIINAFVDALPQESRLRSRASQLELRRLIRDSFENDEQLAAWADLIREAAEDEVTEQNLHLAEVWPGGWKEMEHIAAPECRGFNGYNGYNITAKEVRLTRTVQCLCRKPDEAPFTPELDDEDFEVQGQFFLSGLSDAIDDREGGGPTVTPARHGRAEPVPENIVWSYQDAAEYSLPFHPFCFEIFRRVSSARLGKIDIEGLTSHWYLDSENRDGPDPMHKDPNVHRCAEQYWEHANGTEYLAANPLYMRKLVEILKDCIEPDPAFNVKRSAFPDTAARNDTLFNDIFSKLPVELVYQVLEYLPSQAIAALRLSSRTFQPLPIALFHDLLRREQPWLWEISGTTERPSKWTRINETILKREEYAAGRLEIAFRTFFGKLNGDAKKRFEEQVPDLPSAIRNLVEQTRIEPPEQEYVPLELEKVNWYRLYTLLTRHRSELKGLKNRERIWVDCEGILDKVQEYRDMGQIPLSMTLEEITSHR